MPSSISFPRIGSGRDALACLLCAGVGLVLAVAPHVATSIARGSAEYLADGDDVLYLAIARIPYHGEFSLRDPFADRSRQLPTLYSWMQFVPLSVVTKLVGLPPTLISLVWRVVGGVLVGSALYLLFRRLFVGTRHPIAWAIGCAMTCLADGGFIPGRCLVENYHYVSAMLRGTVPPGNLNGLPQYRVVTPLLNLPFLLIMISCLVPGSRKTLGTILMGGVALGFCFLLYFFFWTAAIVGLSIYIAGLLLSGYWRVDRRASDWAMAKAAAAVFGIGLILGSGQVYENSRTFGKEDIKPVLTRMSRGGKLPADSPKRWQYVTNVWSVAKIVGGGALIVGLGLEGMGFIWCLMLAGYLLQNSAILTNLEFENYHWIYVHGPLGEILVLGIAVRIIERFTAPGRSWPAWLWGIPIVLLVIASVWRPYHALKSPQAQDNARVVAALAPLRATLEGLDSGRVLAGPKEANIALLWTRCGLLYHDPHSSHSSIIPDREVHERHAMNAWLLGMDNSAYSRMIAAAGPFAQGEVDDVAWRPEAVVRAREACFREIQADPEPFLKRYHPDVLLLPADAPAPARGGPWFLAKGGADWSLWTKPGPPIPGDRDDPQ